MLAQVHSLIISTDPKSEQRIFLSALLVGVICNSIVFFMLSGSVVGVIDTWRALIFNAQSSVVFRLSTFFLIVLPVFIALHIRRVSGVISSDERVKNSHGSAAWAPRKELYDSNLMNNTQGAYLGQTQDGKDIIDDSDGHLGIVAPTRKGKSTAIAIPTNFIWNQSIVASDRKKELWKYTAGWRSEFSYPIFLCPYDRTSARYNPLCEIRKGDHEIQDVRNLISMLSDPEGKEKKDHWLRAARSLLEAAILHVLYAEKEKSIPGVLDFLSDPTRDMKDTIFRMMNTKHIDGLQTHPAISMICRDLLDKTPNELSGVFGTAHEYVALFRDPLVRRATSASDFRISDIMDGEYPLSLYLAFGPNDIRTLSPLFRIMIDQMITRLTEDMFANEERYKLLLMLDEFLSLGYLHFFEEQLSYIAGYGIRAMIFVQNLNALNKLYGKDNSIMDAASTRVYYSPNDYHAAKLISESLGNETILLRNESKSKKAGAMITSGVNVSESKFSRPLLNPDEVLSLNNSQAILVRSNEKPYIMKKTPYYSSDKFSAKVLPPPQLAEFDTGRYRYAPPLKRSDWDYLEIPEIDNTPPEYVGPPISVQTALNEEKEYESPDEIIADLYDDDTSSLI